MKVSEKSARGEKKKEKVSCGERSRERFMNRIRQASK